MPTVTRTMLDDAAHTLELLLKCQSSNYVAVPIGSSQHVRLHDLADALHNIEPISTPDPINWADPQILAKYVRRDGDTRGPRYIRVLAWDLPGQYPVAVVDEEGSIFRYCDDGQYVSRADRDSRDLVPLARPRRVTRTAWIHEGVIAETRDNRGIWLKPSGKTALAYVEVEVSYDEPTK